MAAHEFNVAHLDDLGDKGLHQVEINGDKILLVRDGQHIRAIGGTGPHAGAPLAEGVRHGNRIICPWHKAAFCVRTGAVLDPPAVDALPRYDVRIDNGRILVAKPTEPPPDPPRAHAPDPRCFVIVGAGAAGAVAAQTLREHGFTGRLVMVDDANRVPYDRTILSKYALSGRQGAEKSPLQTQSWYQEHDIERRTGELIRIDPAARRLFCADGAVLDYDAALLATGANPARSDLQGCDLDHVYTLRGIADANAILAQAERSTRAVILGASFIGMEVAASLRERGLHVTVIAQESVPFEKQLGPEIGGAFVGLHEQHGVSFRMNTEVAALTGPSSGEDDGALNGEHERCVTGVRLAGGEVVPADLVVIGYGVRPSTHYAETLNCNDEGAINVDANLRAADNLYAAGDIARFPERGDGAPIRVEHWRVAQQHGRIAALNMLGQPIRYDAVPFFWTIHYMKRLDYVGHASKWDNIVVHGDLSKPEFLAYYVKDGVVAAAAGLGRDQDTAALVELFTHQRTWRADELGDDPQAVLQRLL